VDETSDENMEMIADARKNTTVEDVKLSGSRLSLKA